jgi:nucleoside-diphosphate kinase
MLEQSLIIIKPDGICKKAIGNIIKRFEDEKFKIKAMKMVRFTREKAEEFYHAHKEKPFFPGLIRFMLSAPSLMIILEGEDAVKRIRCMIGARVPSEAEKGTIRGDFGADGRRNIIHGSDSVESADYEIGCLFGQDEIYSYNDEDWFNSESA